jgi:hypothetical protein
VLKQVHEKMMKELTSKEAELRALVLRNQEIIEKWTNRQLSTMEDIVVVELESTRVRIVEKLLEMPQYIIKENYDAKLELIERERQELRKVLREEFRKRIEDLEANILAYQDLLITKEDEIHTLSVQLSQLVLPDMSEQTKKTILEFQKSVLELQ